MQKLFNQCPACGSPLVITECKCPACQLQMRGEFQPGQLSNLSDETLTFIKVFLTARGNLTEVERVLGISYPTIRNKLDEINSILNRNNDTIILPDKTTGSAAEKKAASVEDIRKDILQQVSDGRLSPAEAVQKLKDLQG
ncbi:MAG: DUF2089 domain-containing protein [Dehalococcoidales bacterium]|jgi:hypothetical protein